MKMHEFTEAQKQIFRKLGVAIVYFFGSQSNGKAGELSDADFGVVLSDPSLLDKDYFGVYAEIFDIIEDVLPKEYLERRMKLGGHEFDLVLLQRANPRMRFKAATEGQALYRSSARAEADFYERAMLEYFDFQYFESIATEAFLATH